MSDPATALEPPVQAVPYRFYALRLRCDRELPGFSVALNTPDIDVEVRLEARVPWPDEALRARREVWYPSAGRPTSRDSVVTVWKLADGAFYEMRYGDGTEFLLDGGGSRIWSRWPDPLTIEDACTYLLGPVLGFVLRLRGITCLHASAIDVAGRAVALVGPGGSGKSTAAAAFAQSGFGVLTDDVAALATAEGGFLVQPAFPRVGLWSDSVEALFGSPDRLPRQTPNWEKCYLDLGGNGYAFRREPLPLGAIYLLGERDREPRAPFVEPLAPRLSLTGLIENAYVNYLLDGPMRAQDFDVLARLAMAVPVRRAVPNAAAASLPKLRDVILDDLERAG